MTITSEPAVGMWTGSRIHAGAPVKRLVADAFEGFAGGEGHPCLGARSVVHRSAYTLGIYDRMGSAGAAAALNEDLGVFAASMSATQLSSFVAVFDAPTSTSEAAFSRMLWRQLQLMHDLDSVEHGWDPRVSADPDDPHFSFSVGGCAFFVVGLHAASSRWARRFAWPTLVFNPHEQFVAMRDGSKYARARSMIRDRDVRLQGSGNPMLRDHGSASEARQYAGDAVPASWCCPLAVRDT